MYDINVQMIDLKTTKVKETVTCKMVHILSFLIHDSHRSSLTMLISMHSIISSERTSINTPAL